MKGEASILLGLHAQKFSRGHNFFAEWQFSPPRRWKFDYAIPILRVAFELEGGIYVRGRHTRGAGYQKDLEKYNTAAALGWTVFRFSTEDVLKGRDLEILNLWRQERAA